MERYIIVDTLKNYPLELEKYREHQDDTELVQIAVKKNGMALQYASKRLQDDPETVMIAVKKNGLSLQFASEALKNNKKIVQQAVTSNGNALEFVLEELRNNREVVLTASHTCNAEFIPSHFLADEDIAWNLMEHDSTAFAFLADELRNNVAFASEAVRQNPDMLMYIPEEFFENKENVLMLVSVNAAALEEAPERFKNDREIAIAAMKATESPRAYSLLSDELQRDTEIIRRLVENIEFNNFDEFSFMSLFDSKNIPEELLSDNEFISRIADIYECTENLITLDKRLVLRMIELSVFNKDIFDDDILDDPDIKSAIEKYMSEDEWEDE